MDHRYIDDRSVAARYLDQTLPACERAQFEAHLVDCLECTDRLLLAEMFHHRNGVQRPAADPEPEPARPADRRNLRLVFWGRRFWPWQLFLILGVAAAALVLAASSLLLRTVR
jgi:anti-sigma factor RsiW